jgi:hypothetical protein
MTRKLIAAIVALGFFAMTTGAAFAAGPPPPPKPKPPKCTPASTPGCS